MIASKINVRRLTFDLICNWQLSQKYGTKSLVWKHFSLMTDESGGGIQPDSLVC